ncbi:hypothetical protein MMPV_000555 [Pyropia vietnamensis]
MGSFYATPALSHASCGGNGGGGGTMTRGGKKYRDRMAARAMRMEGGVAKRSRAAPAANAKGGGGGVAARPPAVGRRVAAADGGGNGGGGGGGGAKRSGQTTTEAAAAAANPRSGQGDASVVLHMARASTSAAALLPPGMVATPHPGRPLSALQSTMASRLAGAHFRILNESLYTSTGAAAFASLSAAPELYAAYHAGFAAQAATWPANPLDAIIRWLRGPGREAGAVADFGCGDARLAAEVASSPGKRGKYSKGGARKGGGADCSLGRVVHSFDLVATNDRVTACNMAATPLANASVGVAVFCLSLMGTNYMDYLAEAARVLSPGGWLLIAEVASRFDAPRGDRKGKGESGGDVRAPTRAPLRIKGARRGEGASQGGRHLRLDVDDGDGDSGGGGGRGSGAGGGGIDGRQRVEAAFVAAIEAIGFRLDRSHPLMGQGAAYAHVRAGAAAGEAEEGGDGNGKTASRGGSSDTFRFFTLRRLSAKAAAAKGGEQQKGRPAAPRRRGGGKSGPPTAAARAASGPVVAPPLRPCLYKRR